MKHVGVDSYKRELDCNESDSAIARIRHKSMRTIRACRRRAGRAPINVVERYVQYSPPVDAQRLIRKAARIIPDRYLSGINCVVLTNGAAMPRRRRRAALRSRKRKVVTARVLGLYRRRPGRRGEIELFVDRILGRVEKLPRMLRKEHALLALGRVFYHEVGHHIDFTKRPAIGERETTAERYESEYWSILFARRLPIVLTGVAIALMQMVGWMVVHPVESWYRLQFLWFLYAMNRRRRKRLEAYANA